jgi:hypothetical protein
VERVVFVLNAVEVVLDVDVDVPNVVVKEVVVERLAGIFVLVSNCVVVLLLVELEVPKVTVVLNEVVVECDVPKMVVVLNEVVVVGAVVCDVL